MAKKVQVPTAQVNGNQAFPESKITDVSRIGEYAQDSADAVTAAFILAAGGPHPEVGGALVLTGSLGFDIFPPLSVFRKPDGKEFTLMQVLPQAFTLNPADSFLPRVDVVYATLQENVDAAQETRHFKVDPTDPASQEGDVSVFGEKWDELSLGVVTGTPAAQPIAPSLPPSSVLLYTIPVNAGATVLSMADVTDNRYIIEDLEDLGKDVAALRAEVNGLLADRPPFPAREINIEAGAGEFSGLTAQDAFALIANFSDESSFDPITRPETLTIDGKLGAVPNLDGALPVIDMPVGIQVAFSNSIRSITKSSIPTGQNPRLVNQSGSAGTQTQTHVTPLNLGAILSIESDGGGDFALKAAHAPAAAANMTAAARDSQFIEVYGGGSGQSNWWTYDAIADQATPRTLAGTIPASGAGISNSGGTPAMFSCGDGRHMLLAVCGPGVPRWFVIDTQTWISTEVFGGPSSGTDGQFGTFIGDLVQPGVIVIVAMNAIGTGLPGPFWSFNTNTNTFTSLTVTGSVPSLEFATQCDACLYQQGQLVLFQTHGFPSYSADTFVFDYPTLTWTRLSISQPVGPSSTAILTYFKVRNIGGRPTIVAGHDWETRVSTAAWSLSPSASPAWTKFTTALPARWSPGAASLLVGGLPKGSGYVFGGLDIFNFTTPTADIFGFAAGGVIETLLNGVVGLTLAPGAVQATIRLNDFGPMPWQVGSVLATLAGQAPAGSIQLLYSFDGGNTFVTVPRDAVTAVAGAGSPTTRQLKIVLTSQGSVAPIITQLTELFEQVAGPSFNQLVLRFDCPAGTRALYMTRDGSMTFDPNINPTSPGQALLLKTTHNGSGNNPSVKNYRNKRNLRVKFTGTKPSGSNPSFDNDLGVAPDFVNAVGITGGATGTLYKVADPGMGFDATVTVTGLSSTGDGYSVTAMA